MSRIRYPTDRTDAQWQRIALRVPKPEPGGQPAKYSRREIVNAILYQTRNGCVWRALLPYHIVFHSFRLRQQDGTWDRIHETLQTNVRQAVGKKPQPSVAILNSQSVQTTEQSGPRGTDGGKQNRWSQAVCGSGHAGTVVGVAGRAGLGAGSCWWLRLGGAAAWSGQAAEEAVGRCSFRHSPAAYVGLLGLVGGRGHEVSGSGWFGGTAAASCQQGGHQQAKSGHEQAQQ